MSRDEWVVVVEGVENPAIFKFILTAPQEQSTNKPYSTRVRDRERTHANAATANHGGRSRLCARRRVL